MSEENEKSELFSEQKEVRAQLNKRSQDAITVQEKSKQLAIKLLCIKGKPEETESSLQTQDLKIHVLETGCQQRTRWHSDIS